MTNLPARPLLVSGIAHDVHAHAVRWGLRAAGADPLWIRGFDDPALSPSIGFACDMEQGGRWLGAFAQPQLSVWHRRYRDPGPAQMPHVAAADHEFVGNEWKRFGANINALAASIPGSFWVNPPEAAMRAENKLVQLQAAHRCGLRFPQTLISSDPAAIRAFVARHGRVVYKPFQIHSWQDAKGSIHSTYTRIVDTSLLQNDASLRLCPGIFQQLVEKTHDLRVNVIGKRIFAAKLQSPEPQGEFADWRIASLGRSIRYSATELPAELAARIMRLMDQLQLVFGCLDFVADASGQLHFLEINQAGQFLFLEQDVPKLPMLRAICAMLQQARPDYAIDAIPSEVSFNAYLQTDEHVRWWDSVSGDIRKDGVIPGVTREQPQDV